MSRYITELDRHSARSSQARVGFEIVVVLMIIFQIYEEFVELKTLGTATYFSSFFNWLDWTRYTLSAAIVFVYFVTLNHPVRQGLVLVRVCVRVHAAITFPPYDNT